MARALSLETEKIIGRIDGNGIGWLIFNQPERHNALSLAMWQGIADVLESFSQDPSVRVAIMRGAGGKAFVSGADISEFEQVRATAEQEKTYAATTGRANRWLAGFEKPLIALIEGFCIGGGLATALAADVRIATPDSRFGIPAARLGLGYGYAGLAKLARLVGPARARDILFSARFMEADEALSMGLVNFVYSREEIEAETISYAQTIAANAPLTVKAAKAALNAWERGGLDAEVQAAEALARECFDSSDYEEGRRAFREKRTPDFNGR